MVPEGYFKIKINRREFLIKDEKDYSYEIKELARKRRWNLAIAYVLLVLLLLPLVLAALGYLDAYLSRAIGYSCGHAYGCISGMLFLIAFILCVAYIAGWFITIPLFILMIYLFIKANKYKNAIRDFISRNTGTQL